ncbi:pre-toxin TG domain-containing protein [Metabacillus halosaccharovorans]|uniref:pre-toxin TG domain-containing protein n=1 Tax=Metabacillus halosaccharovorans TaxID=930124 RepID=UPI0020A81211|nr:pre-toxin TG domain-containing protein [Metabacillus halosaccharovorans]
MLEATAQGNTISPINFDAQAYKASEAYQLSDEVQQYADDYLSFKEDQEKIREELKKAEELENRPIYEKAWDTVKTFTGEATGYYDFLRAKDGVDPVTGEELTDGQRVAAGAMGAAGFIPIVGWGGRLFKGGSAIYKTAKGMNAADQALSVYKTTSTFSNLQKAELGIYGLASANGLSEYIIGKDMFGNELTDVQRQSSLFNSILGASLVASPFVPALVKNGKLVKEETLKKMHKLATNTKASARYVYDEVRGGMQVLFGNQNMNFAFAGEEGVKPILSNVMNSQEVKKRIEEVVSKFSFGKNLNDGKDSITKSEYKNLRKKTPNNEIRKMVNPDGPKVDPVYGYEVDKFEADHIVSMKEITEMDGFSRLTREQQIEILNLKENFVGLGKSSNASKGANSWADWKGHSKMGEVPVNVRMEMLEKEEQAREALKVAIEERLK